MAIALAVAGCAGESVGAFASGSTAEDGASEATEARDASAERGRDARAPRPTGEDDTDASAAGPAVDIFGDAPLLTTVPESANSHHLRSITDRACLDCHGGPNATPDGLVDTLLSKRAPQFVFGGTVRMGDRPARGVEIRLVDNGGAVGAVVSDEDGNFWLKVTSSAKSASAGARDAKGKALMHGALAHGNCAASGCHDDSHRITLR